MRVPDAQNRDLRPQSRMTPATDVTVTTSGSPSAPADPIDLRSDLGAPASPPAHPHRLRVDPEAWRSAAAQKVVDVIDLPDEPAPRLQRPVLMVHGFLGDASDYAGMITWLGRDGANQFGGVIAGGQPFEADPKANFFVLEFSKRWNPIERNVSELKAAVDAICRQTGAKGVDIVAHSKGGLDVRTYLGDPDEKVDHLLLLGSPAHGAILADLGAFARDALHVNAFPPSNDPDATTCLQELSADRLDRDGTPTNPVLHELNARWDEQKGRADIMGIAGVGIPTVGGRLGTTPMGDGLVTERSAWLPGVPFKRLFMRAHQVLPFSKSVMREMAAFFTDSPSPEGRALRDDA